MVWILTKYVAGEGLLEGQCHPYGSQALTIFEGPILCHILVHIRISLAPDPTPASTATT